MCFSISCYNKIPQTLPQATASHNFNVFTIFYFHRGARGWRCFSLSTIRSFSAFFHVFPFVYSSTSLPETYTCSLTCLLTYSMEQRPSWGANRFSIKTFPAFYGTRRFIAAFISARHLSLSPKHIHIFINLYINKEKKKKTRKKT